ncbi:hypothetical protein ACJX0J_016006, partial [Zea mays]
TWSYVACKKQYIMHGTANGIMHWHAQSANRAVIMEQKTPHKYYILRLPSTIFSISDLKHMEDFFMTMQQEKKVFVFYLIIINKFFSKYLCYSSL